MFSFVKTNFSRTVYFYGMCINIQVEEAVEAQYVPVEDEEQLTDAPVAALQNNGKS